MRMLTKLGPAVSSPEFVTDTVQVVKCVVAATAAWWISVNVLESPMPFLAPWTALLTVHATVYRSLARGLQTTVASAVGVGLSFVVGAYLGVGLWTFALAMLVGLAGSRLTWLKDEGVAIATTSIFILGSGFSSQAPLLDERMIEVGLGVLVGVVVNLLLVPPLRDQQAARYVDHMNRRMGEVLVSMADQLADHWDTDQADAWIAETVSIDDELESAWQTVRFARESARMNPRQHVLALRSPRAWRERRVGRSQQVGYEEILTRVGEGVSHLRHLARTVSSATYAGSRWDDEFRQPWLAIVRDAGRAIEDPDAEVEPIFDRLDSLSKRLARQDMGDSWPLYGSLVTSMRHIAVIVDDVASAREARDASRDNPRP